MFSLSYSLVTSFGSTVMSSMEENGLAPFEGRSESPSCVKADWNCRLHMSTFSFASVLRIPFINNIVYYRLSSFPKRVFLKTFDK